MHATEHQAALLRAAVEEIKQHPETFDMSVWASRRANSCGTVCCLAGQIVCNGLSREAWIDVVDHSLNLHPDDPVHESIVGLAAERLGISVDDDWCVGPLGALFLCDSWPRQFVPDVVCDGTCDDVCFCDPKPTPEQLEARVEHWINTGE